MRPFNFDTARDPAQAARLASSGDTSFLAGGTTLLDLMKLDVVRPTRIVDITGMAGDRRLSGIDVSQNGLRLGALARMSAVADDAAIKRAYPLIAQSLSQAASAQLRNMATLGGNVLQRTRCGYFRDTSYEACNKRNPGSGCSARDGFNRLHAVLGVDDRCIASYPGDFAQALMVLDARVEIVGVTGQREIAFAQLHRDVDTPDRETTLAPGDLITAFLVPAGDHRRSMYLKVRDRQSYAFANASAAISLIMEGDTVREARIALGGVAYKPWRATAAEQSITGKRLTEDTAREAAERAFEGARTHEHNAFKVPLGKAVVIRALLETARLEV